MKQIAILTFLLIALLSSCNSKEKEESFRKREETLRQKEQQLLVQEKTLQLKEEALLKREEALNAPLLPDSTARMDSTLLGNWNVKMFCTETTCQGSAIGDTKNEQWNIIYLNDQFVAKVIANDNLVRVYSGIYTGNTLELIAEQTETTTPPAAKMIVRLRKTNKNTLEGQREIVRANGCKIIYDLQVSR